MAGHLLHGKLFKCFFSAVRHNVDDALACLNKAQNMRDQLFARGRTGDDVGFRHGARLLFKRLRETAGQHGDGFRVCAFGAAQPLAAFFIAAGSNSAAVDDVDIGGFIRLCQRKAVFGKQLLHGAGFVLIDFAAKGIKSNFHVRYQPHFRGIQSARTAGEKTKMPKRARHCLNYTKK